MKIRKIIPLFALAIVGIFGVAYLYRDLWGAFTGNYKITMFVADAGSLPNGTFVYFDGIKVGVVSDTKLSYPGVKVEIKINEGVLIPANAIFSITPKGMIGGLQINVYSPSRSVGRYLKDGDIVEGTSPSTAAALIDDASRLARKADRVIEDLDYSNIGKEVNKAIVDYNENIKVNLEESIKNVKDTTASLRSSLEGDSIKEILDGAASLSRFIGAIFGDPSLRFSLSIPISPSNDYFSEIGVRTNSFLLTKSDFDDWSKGYSLMLRKNFKYEGLNSDFFVGILRNSLGFACEFSYSFLWGDFRVYDLKNINYEAMLGVIVANMLIVGPSYKRGTNALGFSLKFDSGL